MYLYQRWIDVSILSVGRSGKVPSGKKIKL
jgi:hypothetical protein